MSAQGRTEAAGWAIDARNLRKSFGGREVVRGISLKVRRGEIYGFLGPNGSGKTTTIRMLCGLLTPSGGGGRCLGYDIVRESRMIRLHVGYMTQQFSLYSDLTVGENLAFVARVYGMARPVELAERTAREMGLGARLNQLAGTLSGGWKQRLALAACTLHDPQLLLLDEPTAGVDPKARRDFWDSIHALASRGVTVLVSTHYMDEAERCHELAYIYKGRILANGPVDRIVAQSGLAAFSISGGRGLDDLARHLAGLPQVESVTFRGDEMHVAGRAGKALADAVHAACKARRLTCTADAPTLEDVFIHFMEDRPKVCGGEAGA